VSRAISGRPDVTTTGQGCPAVPAETAVPTERAPA